MIWFKLLILDTYIIHNILQAVLKVFSGSCRCRGSMHPHWPTAIFSRERYGQALAYLIYILAIWVYCQYNNYCNIFGKLLQQEAICYSKCTKKCLATGLHLGPQGRAYSSPRL